MTKYYIISLPKDYCSPTIHLSFIEFTKVMKTFPKQTRTQIGLFKARTSVTLKSYKAAEPNDRKIREDDRIFPKHFPHHKTNIRNFRKVEEIINMFAKIADS